jgi:hypothetical protein
VEKFLTLTHEAYKERFGETFSKKIEGFFTDEPQYQRWATPYTDMVAAYWKEQYGEDILDGLGLLFAIRFGGHLRICNYMIESREVSLGIFVVAERLKDRVCFFIIAAIDELHRLIVLAQVCSQEKGKNCRDHNNNRRHDSDDKAGFFLFGSGCALPRCFCNGIFNVLVIHFFHFRTPSVWMIFLRLIDFQRQIWLKKSEKSSNASQICENCRVPYIYISTNQSICKVFGQKILIARR